MAHANWTGDDNTQETVPAASNPGLSDLIGGIGLSAPATPPAPTVPAAASPAPTPEKAPKAPVGRPRKSKPGKMRSSRNDGTPRRERVYAYCSSAEKKRIRLAALNADATVNDLAFAALMDLIESTYTCRDCGCRFTISSFASKDGSGYSATHCPSCGGAVDVIDF